jgi:hypothetical protein
LTSTTIPDRVYVRALSRLEAPSVDACWLWPMSVGNHGYGEITWREPGRGRHHNVLVHRVVYELFNGPIPDDMTVDHECRTRRCANPGHLRLLSNADNARGNGQSIVTECPQGHPYDETNTYRMPATGWRRCRTCTRLRQRGCA